MTTLLGKKIREMRIQQDLLLRHVASHLDIDSSIISKMERGERPIKREQIELLANILKIDQKVLLTLWLEDQVMSIVKDEPLASEVLNSILKKIRNIK